MRKSIRSSIHPASQPHDVLATIATGSLSGESWAIAMPRFVFVWAILAVVVGVTFGALVPSLHADLHLSLSAIGAVGAANVIGYVVGTPFATRIIRRLGLRRASIYAHGLSAVAAACCVAATAAGPLIALRAVTGLAGAVGIVAALRIVLDAVPPARRIIASTIAWCGIGAGILVAAAAQDALYPAGRWRIATIVWAMVTLVVALSTPRQAEGVTAPSVSDGTSPRSGGSVLAAYVAFGFAYLAYTTFLAMTGAGPASSRWALLGVASLGGSLFVLRVKRPEIAFAATLLAGAAGASATERGLAVGPLLVGIGLSAAPALATAILRSRATTAGANAAIAAGSLAVAAGQLAGPLVAGLVAEHVGLNAVPELSATIYLLGAALVAADFINFARRVHADDTARRSHVLRHVTTAEPR
jgi:MFS family permease